MLKQLTKIGTIGLLLVVLFSSCANERKFVRFYEKCEKKNDTTALHHINEWQPIKERVITNTAYKSGKPIVKAGKTITLYANCDSAYQAELKAAKGDPKKIKKIQSVGIRVRTGDTILSVDTFSRYVLKEKESTAKLAIAAMENKSLTNGYNSLISELNNQKKLTEEAIAIGHTWRKWALGLSGLILLFLLGIAAKKYFKTL